jgi:hypothetical protein
VTVREQRGRFASDSVEPGALEDHLRPLVAA